MDDSHNMKLRAICVAETPFQVVGAICIALETEECLKIDLMLGKRIRQVDEYA